MIKSFAFIAIICFVASVSDAFQTSTPSFSLRSSSSSPSSMQMIFGFGEQKDDGKPGDYLCKVSIFGCSFHIPCYRSYDKHLVQYVFTMLLHSRSPFTTLTTRCYSSFTICSSLRTAATSLQRGLTLGQSYLTITNALRVEHQSSDSRRCRRGVLTEKWK
jgi:hypothetical protein